MHTTLISTSDLASHLDDPDWLVVDCRFTLTDPQKSENDHLAGHIPGAVYAHLERDLSGAILPGVTGRHPLPAPEQAAASIARLGISRAMQVVAYDDAGGALAAARLWWMLRWLGHARVAVLDGGCRKWRGERRPTHSGRQARPPGDFMLTELHSERLVDAAQVQALRLDPGYRLIDVRLPERYHGITEPIDPVAGHIPGAINVPYSENLTPEGIYRPPEELRRRYLEALGGVPAEKAVFYCGSGVTSIHSILALLHAGLGEARLYAGSWSEWIVDPERPVARD